MAAKQRDISVSEFFLKNRHLLGFDNAKKALLTTVREAVDNSLDACEEAKISPEILIEIKQLEEDRFTVIVADNGPGVVKEQIPRIFGKHLSLCATITMVGRLTGYQVSYDNIKKQLIN